jgi:hypothetical protein
MQSALKWGALTGAALYIFAGVAIPLLSDALFGTPDLTNPGVLIFGCLGVFLLLFGFSAAGFFTGRDTLKPRLGAVAAIIALALYAVLTALYTPHAGPSPVAASATSAKNPVGQAIAALVADAFVGGLAALMGWLGGRPGAQRARRMHQEAAATFKPGAAESR